MKAEWLKHCVRLSKRKADLYAGCRKILFDVQLTFHDLWDYEHPLELEDAGYTRNKLAHLVRGYLHQESIEKAVMLWELRRKKTSYGSVGFTCYNHFLKNDAVKKSKRASVMGPCIQAVTITQLKGNGKNGKGGRYKIDAFYRTTELFKKFPADLVFIRDVLLKDFDFSGMEFEGMTCHFANVTIHPQYAVTPMAHMDKPWEIIDEIKAKDQYFADWWIKWSARYLCEEHYRGIAKFAQALRVKDHADAAFKGKKRKKLTQYLRDNHPGHRNEYVDPAEDDGDE